MADQPIKCEEYVWDHGSYRGHPCGRRALPGSKYCGIHDPDRRAARAAARGPTVWERRMAADQKRHAEHVALAEENVKLRAEVAKLREELDNLRKATEWQERL